MAAKYIPHYEIIDYADAKKLMHQAEQWQNWLIVFQKFRSLNYP